MYFVIAALTFGLVAGLKPGPLGIFIIHETMAKGKRHGFLSSLAPLLTDGPIILLALLLTQQSRDISWFLSIISIIGAGYLLKIAYSILKAPNKINPLSSKNEKASLVTAVKINFLNPAPYIFWLTIGTSYILMGTTADAMVFVICALFSLCATKFIVAVLIAELGQKFNPKVYAFLMKLLALPLIVFSVQLFIYGLDIL